MSEPYEKWTPPEGFKWIYASLLISMLLGALLYAPPHEFRSKTQRIDEAVSYNKWPQVSFKY